MAAAIAAVNFNLYKPILAPAPGSQIHWHRSHGALSTGNNLVSGSEKWLPANWRVCNQGNKGIQSSNLIFVDEVLSSSAETTISPENDVPDVRLEAPENGMDLPEVPGDGTNLPETGIPAEAPQGSEDFLPDLSPSVPIDEGQGGGALEIPGSENLDGNPSFSAADDAFNAMKNAVDEASRTLSEIQETGANFFVGIREKVTGSIADVENSIKDFYDDINGSVLRILRGAEDKLDDTVSGLRSSLKPPPRSGLSFDFTSPFRTGTPVNNALKEFVILVRDGIGGAGHAVYEAYGFAKGSAPVEVQTFLNSSEQKLAEVSSPIASALHQVFDAIVGLESFLSIDPDNPIIPIFLVGGGGVYLGFLLWNSKYGGYAGDLPANVVFDMLKKDRVVLVDVRPQELRERDGVPDVRRGGRFKLAGITCLEVERPVRDLLRNAGDVDCLLTAAVIRNLKNVQPSSKVVIMDADGTQSKRIAKALRKSGIRKSYRLEGGFAAWTKSGMGQKPEGRETPLQILKEETEAVVDELKPIGIAAVALGSLASVYALYEWEKTLQFLGVIAIFQLIYRRVDNYSTVEELNADLRTLQAPFRLAISWLGGQPRANKLELATSPSTTAVQDRVVQAAAKHGLKPDGSQALEDVEEQEQSEQEAATAPTVEEDANPTPDA